MYKVTDDVIDLFKKGYRQVLDIKAELVGIEKEITITDEDIIQGTFNVNHESCATGDIGIGEFNSAEIQFVLNNFNGKFDNIDFSGAQLYVRIGIKKWDALQWEKAVIQYIPIGYFTVDLATETQDTISITGLDRAMLFSRDYGESTLNYPATISQVIDSACADCGVKLSKPISEMLNSNYVVNKKPEENNLTYRTIVMYALEIMGCCAFINYEGRLEIKWYEPTGQKIVPADRFSSELQQDSLTVTGIEVTGQSDNSTDKTIYLAGDRNGLVFSLDGNALVQHDYEQLAASLADKLIGFNHTPWVAETLNMPYVQPFDMFLFVDSKGQEHNVVLSNADIKINSSTRLEGIGTTNKRLEYAKCSPLTRRNQIIIKDLDKRLTAQQQGTIDLNEAIVNSMGLYKTKKQEEDGSFKYYMHNKPKLEESDTIYTMVEGGFAFTTSGWNNGNPVWQYGVDKAGNAILNTLVANKISADLIQGGVLSGVKIEANASSSDEVMITASYADYEMNVLIMPSGLESRDAETGIYTQLTPVGIEIRLDDNSQWFSSSMDELVFSSWGKNGMRFDSAKYARDGVSLEEKKIIEYNGGKMQFGCDPMATPTENQLRGRWYGTLIGSSDRNKKHGIESLNQKYLVLFDKLIPVRFKYNDDIEDKFSLGFIAQDVKKALEESDLSTDDFKGYYEHNGSIGLEYQQFIALNTMAIKALKDEVKALKEEIVKLKSQLDDIK